MTELGKVEHTMTGDELVIFKDARDLPCFLQNAGDGVRVGQALYAARLDRDQVRALNATLQSWLDTGSFAPPERAEVVVVGGNHREFAYALVDAFEACESPTVIVVDSAQRMRLGVASLALLYDGKDVTFKLTDPALAPVGECECGAERAAENGRCEDGCDDD